MQTDRKILSRAEWDAIVTLHNVAGAALEDNRVRQVQETREAHAIVSALLVRTSPFMIAAELSGGGDRDRHPG